MQVHNKSGKYKWKTYRERQDDREEELIERLENMGFDYDDYFNCGLCERYVDRGGSPTLDEICEQLELDAFLEKYTKYEELRKAYIKDPQYIKDIKNKKSIYDMYNTIKKQAFEKYVMENKDNVHKILSEIPWSLKKQLDEIYATLNDIK